MLRSRTGFVCAAILAMLTGLVMVRVAESLEPYSAASSEVSGSRTSAQHFYDAVNQVLLTGSEAVLSEHVAVDARFSNGFDDDWLGTNVLVGRLVDVGEANPHAQLDVTSLTIDGTEAVAIVRLTGAGDRLTATTSVDGSDSWIDKLTIRDGIVSALSGGTASLRSATLMFDETVRHSGSLANVGLVRLSIKVGEAIPVTAPGPLAAVIDRGTLQVDFDNGSAPALVHGGDPFDDALKSGLPAVLRAGDGFSVLQGSEFTLSGTSSHSASIQLIALLNPIPGGPEFARREQHGRFSGFLVNGSTGSTWEGPTGGQASMVSRLEFTSKAGLQQLRVERIDFVPGSRLYPDLTASPDRQFVLQAMEGAVVVAPLGNGVAKDAPLILLDRQQSNSLIRESVQVSQVGETHTVLMVIGLEHLGAV